MWCDAFEIHTIEITALLMARCYENAEKYWHKLSNRIHFPIKTVSFLTKYYLLYFQFPGRLKVFFNKHDFFVLRSFMKEI